MNEYFYPMSRKLIRFCLFTMVVFATINLSLTNAQLPSLQLQNYNTEDGLPHNNVNDLIQDRLGNIWIATQDGLARFDGRDFTVFQESAGIENTISGSVFMSVYEDKNGLIWAGTLENGLNKIDPVTGKIVTYKPIEGDSTSLSAAYVRCIFEDDLGQLWIGSNGLLKYDPENDNFERYQLFSDAEKLKEYNNWQNTVERVVATKTPHVFLVQAACGIYQWNTKTYEIEPLQFCERGYITTFRSFAEDMDGNLWIGQWNNNMLKFDPTSNRLETIADEVFNAQTESVISISDIYPLNNNQLLVASTSQGLLVYDIKKNQMQAIDQSALRQNLPAVPSTFHEDLAGNLWITTYGQGVFVNQKHKEAFRYTHIGGGIMKAIKNPVDSKIYLADYDHELVILDDQTNSVSRHRPFQVPRAQDYGMMDMAINKAGEVFLLDRFGIYQWDNTRLTLQMPFAKEIRDSMVAKGYYWHLAIDKSGDFWIPTQNYGLGHIENGGRTIRHYDHSGKHGIVIDPSYSMTSPYIDDNDRLWLGISNAFLYLDLHTQEVVHYPSPSPVTTGTKGFTDVHYFTQDHTGMIWLGEDLNFIGLLDPKKAPDQPIEVLEEVMHLPGEEVQAIATDLNGDIWIGTSLGLTLVDLPERDVTHYGDAYGVGSIRNITVADDGEILAVSGSGFYRLYPDSIEYVAPAVVPVIQSFKVFDSLYANSYRLQNEESIRLSYKENFFSLDYGSLDFASKEEKEYSYRLSGLEDEWIYAGNRQYAAYTNLAGGEYLFELRTRRKGEAWNANPAVVPIVITMPLWKKAWFPWLVALVGMAIVWALFRYREQTIKEKQELISRFDKQLADVEMQALRSQMNPHFLFNSLNSIKYYVVKKSARKAAGYIDDFSRLIRLILQNSRQKLIPLGDELEALQLYIKVERLRFEEQFDYELNIQDDLDTSLFDIPPLLLQPYVENAIWHGLMHKEGKGKLSISVNRDHETLQFVIEDNGIGRQMAAQLKSKTVTTKKSLGMQITRQRMEISEALHNMEINVNVADLKDNEGRPKGTRVTIHISPKPLKI